MGLASSPRSSATRSPKRPRRRLRRVPRSVYELHLAITASSTDDERARAIVAKLSEQRRVEDIGGSWWRTEYLDHEDREAAAAALHADLRAIDEHWGEVLHAGYMHPPDDTPEALDH
jgi:hypothetical protein